MFELSADHEEFRALVREFAEAEIEPRVAQWDKDSHFPAELIPKLGELGLFGLVVPEEFGGTRRPRAPAPRSAAATSPMLCVAIEELGRVDQAIGITSRSRGRPRHQPDPQLRHP
jgi:alkylation response protein AidB-like acyl-CoA dehydrogenase